MTADDRKARVTQEMELLGPEAMTRSLRAFPWRPIYERETACHCILGYAMLVGNINSGEAWNEGRRLGGKILETIYEDGDDAELLHTWILEWLELNRCAAPAPVAVAEVAP